MSVSDKYKRRLDELETEKLYDHSDVCDNKYALISLCRELIGKVKKVEDAFDGIYTDLLNDWDDIESAPKDGTEILALSDAYENAEQPLIVRWFKYNGKEGWRDWDSDLHFPKCWKPLPDGLSAVRWYGKAVP